MAAGRTAPFGWSHSAALKSSRTTEPETREAMTVLRSLFAFALGVGLGAALIPVLQEPEPLVAATNPQAPLVQMKNS